MHSIDIKKEKNMVTLTNVLQMVVIAVLVLILLSLEGKI